MIVVASEVLPVDEQVMVLVELPELAVDHVEVLVAEEVGDLVDVLLVLEQPQGGQEVGPPHLGQGDLATPASVDHKENPSYHLKLNSLERFVKLRRDRHGVCRKVFRGTKKCVCKAVKTRS